jgi:hypothetical protein
MACFSLQNLLRKSPENSNFDVFAHGPMPYDTEIMGGNTPPVYGTVQLQGQDNTILCFISTHILQTGVEKGYISLARERARPDTESSKTQLGCRHAESMEVTL